MRWRVDERSTPVEQTCSNTRTHPLFTAIMIQAVIRKSSQFAKQSLSKRNSRAAGPMFCQHHEHAHPLLLQKHPCHNNTIIPMDSRKMYKYLQLESFNEDEFGNVFDKIRRAPPPTEVRMMDEYDETSDHYIDIDNVQRLSDATNKRLGRRQWTTQYVRRAYNRQTSSSVCS